MTLSDWADVAEIVGAVVVLASLVYLAFQVRQNTAAIKSSTNQDKLSYGRDSSELLITDPTLRGVVLKAERDLDELDDEERLIFHQFSVWRFANWEHAYLEYRSGIIDEELWMGWDAVYREVVEGKPGYVEYFRQTEPQWDARFRDHLEKVMPGLRDASIG